MDIRGWLLFLRDWVALLVLGTVVAGGAAFAISSTLPRTYEAETQLLVGQSLTAPNPDYSQLLASQVIAQTYAEVGTTRPTFARVLDRIPFEATTDDLAGAVTVRAPAASTFIVITAQRGDPTEAAVIANAVADVLVEGIDDDLLPGSVTVEDLTALDEQIAVITGEIAALLAETELTPTEESQLAQLQDQRDTLRTERLNVIDLLTSSSNKLTVIEPAVAPDEPISPRIMLNAAVGAAIGFILTALVLYIYDTVAKTREPVVRGALPVASSQARARSR